MIPMLRQLMGQLVRKPFTNLFPTNRVPKSVNKFLAEGKINPPVEVPDDYRGKLVYEPEKCIGCYSCIRVCPARVIKPKVDGKKRKVRLELSHCTFCSQCVEVCPVKCLHMSKEFLLADYDKHSKNLTLE